MAIPGKSPEREPVGKIRIGEKRGKYAASVDYFRSDNPLFAELCPGDPNEIEIVFYERNDDAWNSGLEWWVQKAGKTTLACYTKDGGSDPVAKRLPQYLDPEDVVVNKREGGGRCDIKCPFRDCRHFKAEPKQCRPVGRFTFHLANDPERRPWRVDTKSWNSIEAVEEQLAAHPSTLAWKLSVAFESKGTKRYPVLHLEPNVEINTDADISKADALVALARAVDTGEARRGLASYLDATRPGWREEEALLSRLREVGAEEAAKSIMRREHQS